MRDKLTLKQELFCQYYIELKGNGTQAAIKAGYSENTAAEQSKENLNKPYISARIDELLDEALRAAKVTPQSVISDLKRVTELALGSGGEKKNLIAAVAALEKLGKYHKLFVDRTENETTMKMDGNFTFIGEGIQDKLSDNNGTKSEDVQ